MTECFRCRLWTRAVIKLRYPEVLVWNIYNFWISCWLRKSNSDKQLTPLQYYLYFSRCETWGLDYRPCHLTQTVSTDTLYSSPELAVSDFQINPTSLSLPSYLLDKSVVGLCWDWIAGIGASEILLAADTIPVPYAFSVLMSLLWTVEAGKEVKWSRHCATWVSKWSHDVVLSSVRKDTHNFTNAVS